MPAEVPTIEEVRDVVREELERFLADPEVGDRKRWKRASEAAEYIGVGEATLRRLAQSGRLPFVKMSQGTVGYDVRDLDAFMETNKVIPGRLPDEIRHRRIS